MKPTGFQIEKSLRVEQPREKREAQTSAGFLMEMDERQKPLNRLVFRVYSLNFRVSELNSFCSLSLSLILHITGGGGGGKGGERMLSYNISMSNKVNNF